MSPAWVCVVVPPLVLVSINLPPIAQRIDDELAAAAGQRMGFALLVFGNDGEVARQQYISNCSRGDVKLALQLMLKAWDTSEHLGPLHEIH